MMRTLYVLAILSFSLAALPALADGDQARNRAAKKACLTGDFRKGAQILAQLYVDTGNPTHLFNQGRCYEQNHRWQEALDAFREYRRKAPSLSSADQADMEKHIADCEAFLAKDEAKDEARRSPQAMPVPVPPPASLPAPDPAPSRATPLAPPVAGPTMAVSATDHGPASPSDKGSGLRLAGLVTGGFGLAATAAGVLFNLKANQLANDVNQHYSQSKASSQSTYATMGWVGYGVGAAAIAAGATLYAIGWNHGRADSPGSLSVALTPILAPGETRLILKGAF
jgi:hypothetical protein